MEAKKCDLKKFLDRNRIRPPLYSYIGNQRPFRPLRDVDNWKVTYLCDLFPVLECAKGAFNTESSIQSHCKHRPEQLRRPSAAFAPLAFPHCKQLRRPSAASAPLAFPHCKQLRRPSAAFAPPSLHSHWRIVASLPSPSPLDYKSNFK
jgi:hypothetical protein